MSTVHMTIGIPASGKTTWARRYVKNAPGTVIVSRDDIRLAHGLGSGENENFVTQVHRAQIEGALLEGLDVIVADTNLNEGFRRKLVKFCHEHGADVVLYFFPIGLDEAILRDHQRANTVGPVVIKRFYDMYEKQFSDKAPSSMEFLPVPSYDKYEAVHGRHDVIVVDIDGTLAHMDGRSPYDESRVFEDDFDAVVAGAVEGMAEHMKADIVVVSGRTDKFRHLTEQWLDEYGFNHIHLFMRKHGDTRPDYIIKNEIYDAEIIPFYNVLAVFDDRDQVVRHLRRRGITVFQVAPGRF